METLIFSHSTALNAIRSTRTWRGEISWRPCTAEEQKAALESSTARFASLDLRHLRALGVIPDAAANPEVAERPEAIHILVNSSNRRAHWKGCVTHVSSTGLPDNSLRRVTQGVYVPCPELLFIQMATVLDFSELLVLGLELMGMYTLRPNDEDGFVPCEAVMTEDSLTEYLGSARGVDGIKQARRALPYLLERSRSPMETAMALMFSLPRCHGGFGCGKPQLNHTIKLNDKAREACGRTEIECDAYYKEARIDLEYNSIYHNNEKQRQRDDERTAALACMDIQVIPVSASQFKILERLEAIARLIIERANRRYRAVSGRQAVVQANLHGILTEGLNEPPETDSRSEESPENRDSQDELEPA